MHQPRAVLHVLMQLRQASQSKRTGADSNDARRAEAAQQRRPPPVAFRPHFLQA